MFQPGYRGDPRDGHDGAGLGLALAHRLAVAAGGDIRAVPLTPGADGAEPVAGGRFVVLLPSA